MNLYDYFVSRMPVDRNRPFIELPDGKTISYAEIGPRSGGLASMLMILGVRPGDRVAAQVEKSADALLLYLACLRAGAVYLPLNLAYTPAEVRYFLEDAEPALFLCRPADRATMQALGRELGVPQVMTLEALVESAADAPPSFYNAPRADDDLAAILYTSGTTGRSKGAMLTHANLRSNAEVLAALWQFTPDDRLLHALPIFHTHGLFVATNVTLAAGGSMILLPKFDAAEVLRLLPRATTMMGVPTFYTRLLSEPGFDRALVAHMRLFVSGSAPLTAETHKAFAARTGHPILERYGMTETNMITSNPYDGERVAGTVGYALPGVEVRLGDQESGEVVTGEVGVVEVRGPNVFKGYWRMPEKTAVEFRADGFFITGDLGEIAPDGRLTLVGRARDLIISGGLNVYPAEVEGAIDALPGVAESAVIGVPHDDFGEAVVAVAVSNGDTSEAAILGALAGQLARFKQPKRVVFVAELPRNTMGKVQKNALRETYRALFGEVPA
jgi:malonyl-CoA/methylmalonyl-CoA synthetase